MKERIAALFHQILRPRYQTPPSWEIFRDLRPTGAALTHMIDADVTGLFAKGHIGIRFEGRDQVVAAVGAGFLMLPLAAHDGILRCAGHGGGAVLESVIGGALVAVEGEYAVRRVTHLD